MRLEPEAFACQEHGEDLTAAVHAELAEVPVTSFAIGFLRRKDTPRHGRRFCVVVFCSGNGTHHTVVCRGSLVSE